MFTKSEVNVNDLILLLTAIFTFFNSYVLRTVHKLVNSNFSEAKAARLAAETALKTANDLNIILQARLEKLETKEREK